MSADRASVNRNNPLRGTVEIAPLDFESVAAAHGSSPETMRGDRICVSAAARAAVTHRGAPRCLSIAGLERAYKSIELGNGLRLVLDGGLYRLTP